MTVDDDALARLLRGAAELTPGTPGELLADAGERLGRRRVVRRRIAVILGASAVLAVAGLSVAAPFHSGSGDVRVVAAPQPSTTPARQESTPVSGQFMIDTLAALLPPGKIEDTHGEGFDAQKGMGPMVRLVYDDGRGASAITLAISRLESPQAAQTKGAQCPEPAEPTDSCARTVAKDGSVLVFRKIGPAPGGPPTTSWQMVWTGTDGRQVGLVELNSPTAGPPLTRAEPPLSAEQLAAIVTSPAWAPVFEDFARTPYPRTIR
jgi:hypothetical protein